MSNQGSIKNIIFDLGGVLLNIDYHKTAKAFTQIGWPSFADFYSQQQQKELFDQLEIGAINETDFFNQLITFFTPIEHSALKEAWNAMLLDLPAARLAFLQSLRKEYSLFLFSNTNAIHYEAFTQYISNQYEGDSLDNYFDKAYYSHVIGKRKPHPSSFDYILKENNIIPAETLFIDDSSQHIAGAASLGIKTYLFSQNSDIIELFPDIIQSVHR
jgi:putative hydrolase of the HAD superfamily